MNYIVPMIQLLLLMLKWPNFFNDYFASVFTHEHTDSIPTLKLDSQPLPIHTFQFTADSIFNMIMWIVLLPYAHAQGVKWSVVYVCHH